MYHRLLHTYKIGDQSFVLPNAVHVEHWSWFFYKEYTKFILFFIQKLHFKCGQSNHQSVVPILSDWLNHWPPSSVKTNSWQSRVGPVLSLFLNYTQFPSAISYYWLLHTNPPPNIQQSEICSRTFEQNNTNRHTETPIQCPHNVCSKKWALEYMTIKIWVRILLTISYLNIYVIGF